MNYNKGDRIGDYEIVDVLGAGGMGRVYKVRNVISERVEALKVLLPNLESDPDLADRFMREIKVQASLQHPNIACLHTALRVNNQLLMLIEFVEGSTVEAHLRHGPIPVPKAIDYVRQVLLALACAHQHGIVHRDIKPANIMVMPEGTVKLMDFGIARLSADRKLTQTGRTVGSLYYMSPEQIQGSANLDARSDLYSLGVTLYEMVTARRPFQGDSDYSVMAAHLSARPMPPIEIDASLPAALNDVILVAIAKDPAQRFQTADAFRTALTSSLAAPAAPAPAPAAAAEPRSPRGLYMAIGSVATVLVLALVALQAPKLFKGSQAASQPPAQNTAAPPASVQQPESPAVQPEVVDPAPPKSSPRPGPVEPRTTRAEPSGQAVVTPPSPTSQGQAQSTQPPLNPVQQPQVSAPQQQGPDMSAHRETMMLLVTRANSAKSSLARLRQQQAAMGLGLRQDISAAEQRMEFYLDDSGAAVQAGDADRARSSLDKAERAIETIEKFLGR